MWVGEGEGDGDVVRDVVFNRGEAVSAPTVQGVVAVAVAVAVTVTVTVTVTVAKLCLLLLFRMHHGSATHVVLLHFRGEGRGGD